MCSRIALFVGGGKVRSRRLLTSLFNASVALPRASGSMVRRVSIRARADGGKSLKVSAKQRL